MHSKSMQLRFFPTTQIDMDCCSLGTPNLPLCQLIAKIQWIFEGLAARQHMRVRLLTLATIV